MSRIISVFKQCYKFDNKGIIEEILMTVVDDNGLVVMCMFGEFTIDDAKKIVKSIKTDNAIKMKN